MRIQNALRIGLLFFILILLIDWEADISAQPRRYGPERGGMEDIGSTSLDTVSSMVISPDSNYLYLFHANRIYQFKLPGLTLVKSIEVETMGVPERPGRGDRDFIKDFDRDNDGRVSREEFSGPSQLFERFDRNNDGYINRDEAPQ